MYFPPLNLFTVALRHPPVWRPWPSTCATPHSHDATEYLILKYAMSQVCHGWMDAKPCGTGSLQEIHNVKVGKVLGFTELSHPMSVLLYSTSTVWSTIQMVFVVIAGSEWMIIPEHHVESPTDACINLFLLRLNHLEEVPSAVSCLHFLISYLKQATVVIILKYHGAFHEQAWVCHLFSYLYNLPFKLQLNGISQSFLGSWLSWCCIYQV